jgi:hypothetical protein
MTRMRSLFKNIGLKPIAFVSVLFIAAIVCHKPVSAQIRARHFTAADTQSDTAPRPQRPRKTLPDPPRILSFTIAPERIRAGETATLRWSTANTEQVVVGEANPEWPQMSDEAIRTTLGSGHSGSLQVSPSQTVTYTLHARKGGRSVFKLLTIQVTSAPPPPATCTITGQIFGKLTWNSTDDRGQPFSATLRQMYMSSNESDERVYSRLQGRTYTFTNVPAGQTYRISPDNFRARPMERTVSCQPGTVHRGTNFELTGAPPSG